MSVIRLDHVQLAMPAGRETEAVAFYEGVLGIPHVPKPAHLAARGGCWFEDGDLKVHLGVERDFRPALKAHPAFIVDDVRGLASAVIAAGFTVTDDEPLDGYDRVYVADPFGNRIELMQPDAPMDARTSEEFEGDLAGAVFWGADLRGAKFRDVDLTGATISHAWIVDVDVDALVDHVVINGVDVTDFVNDSDPWHPLRAMLRPCDQHEMQAAWALLEDAWADAIVRARALPDGAVHESVDGEWSFVQTLRHLVFAMDKWFTSPILGRSFDPMGIPNSGSIDFPWPELDRSLTTSFADALAVRDERATAFREYVESVPAVDLDRPVDVLENGTVPLLHALHTVFEEEFWHLRYAQRDLCALEG